MPDILQSEIERIACLQWMLLGKSMKWSLVVLLMLPACCAPARAQSLFDGTWKIDLSRTEQSTKLDVYLLQEGKFRCQTCDPVIDVKADGTDQSIAGEECYDTVSIRVLSEHAIEETDKRKGKTIRTLRIEVSPSNKEANFKLTDMCNQRAEPVSVQWLAKRVASVPAGAHLVSGSWRTVKQESASQNALLVTLKLENNTFTFMDPTGKGYSAKLDGTYAPFTGGSGDTNVSVKRLGANSVEETDLKAGKVIRRTVFTVATDGKTMTAAITDVPQESSIQFFLTKQQ
jgi:hypothetical protein